MNASEIGYVMGGMIAVLAFVGMVLKGLHSLFSGRVQTRGEGEKTCPTCGMQQRGTPKFCRGCGLRLR